MRHFTRLFALLGFTAVLTTVASAAPITINSDTSSVTFLGYSATGATPYSYTVPGDSFASPATYNISTGVGAETNTWTAPVGASSWVSFSNKTAPGDSYVAPNGLYEYSASLNITDFVPGYTGSITVMADDTVSVYLNGLTAANEIVSAYNGSSFPKCATGTPNCITPLTESFTGLTAGANTLYFIVNQANHDSTGLDYTVSAVAPEPSSLLLLGTGLVGSAGAMLRRFRRS